MMPDRNKIIRIILLIAFIFAIVYFAPRNDAQYGNNNDMTVIDFYHNIPGFEYASDVVVLHDNKRNATCWVYNQKSISCVSDKDLE